MSQAGLLNLGGVGPGSNVQTLTGNSGPPVVPDGAHNINVLGNVVAAASTPFTTAGSGSTLNINVQKSQAISSTNATKIGLSAFDSQFFTVDGNGFVSFSSTFVNKGTFVPVLTSDGTPPTVVYKSSQASWTRIFDRCYVDLQITWSTFTVNSNNIVFIQTFPFPVAIQPFSAIPQGACYLQNFTMLNYITIQMNEGSISANLQSTSSGFNGGPLFQNQYPTTDGGIYASIVYQIQPGF